MAKEKIIVDSANSKIELGDVVKFLKASEGLLKGLPDSDKQAIKNQVNKSMIVQSFGQYDNVELEFTSSDGHIHSIWVESKHLAKEIV